MVWMKMFGHFAFTTLQLFCVAMHIARGVQISPIVLSHVPLRVPMNRVGDFSETLCIPTRDKTFHSLFH